MQASELLAAKEEANKAIQDRIEELKLTIEQAKAELVALGSKRSRKPKAKGPGRPRGSKNQPKLPPEV